MTVGWRSWDDPEAALGAPAMRLATTAADRRIARRRKDIRAQDNRYRLAGRSVRLERDEGLIAARFRDDMPRDEWALAVEAVDGLLPFETRREVPGERITLLAVTPAGLGGVGAAAAMAALAARPEVISALPIFRVGGSCVVPTGRAIIRFRPDAPVRALLQAHGLVAVDPRDELATPRACEGPVLARVADDADIFQACRELNGRPMVLGAEPDFLAFGALTPAGRSCVPHDISPTQEGSTLRLVRALEAQEMVAARPEIRVAVLGDGIDAGHPDLAGTVVGRFDALRARGPWNWHGTACAGLIAGRGQDGTGIRGVAAGCSLLDVRVGRMEIAGAAWMTGIGAICRGIEWSWREAGAAVILLGWTEALESPEIRSAIEAARTRGRDGRGCLIVAAAGDQPGPVAFPGSLPNLLTVAASNSFDEAKNPWTRDGEPGWGSAHGPEVDLLAPGVQVLSTGPGGRRIRFGGTAAAAAMVAGACALVLSLRPHLTEAELRELLTATADPVGQHRYAEGRNDYCGHGRINVLEAVETARSLL
jgi:thermitase